MQPGKLKPITVSILFFNFCLCIVIFGIGGWVMNDAIDNGFVIGQDLEVPAHFSPIFFKIGNSATGFFVVFSFIAAVAVVASVLSGHFYFRLSDSSNLPPAASLALIACFLTILAMGFAWKEVSITVMSGQLVRNLKAHIVFLAIFLFPFSRLCFSSQKELHRVLGKAQVEFIWLFVQMALEAFVIILSVTQLIYTAIILWSSTN